MGLASLKAIIPDGEPCRREIRLGRRERVALFAVLAVGCCSHRLEAWEGHDWNQWRQVTTWQKPDLRTDQAGRSTLVPLLGGGEGGANRIASVRAWEVRRQEISEAIQRVLGASSDLKPLAVEVRELGVADLEGYTRRHVLIRSEPEDWIPAYLLVPKKLLATRVPAMVCLHQTVAQGKEEPCGIKGDPELAFAVELVGRGFVCIAPDVIGFGERIPPGTQPYHNSLASYRKHPPAKPASVPADAVAPSRTAPAGKAGSAFFPGELVARARANARDHAWAAEIRDALVAAAKPWLELSDEDLWGLMFGNTIRRAWQVWSDGHCPACRKPVPMYEWVPNALKHPWKMRCPQCQELFPKNDFLKFYRSGLNAQGVFEPQRADRSLLFNAEHPNPSDPLHRFGVDDGEGYAEEGKRWRFIGAYLIFGQWKQAIVGGIRNLAAAFVATGDLAYAHKAGVLLDRVADFYPTFDFGKEGVMYEGPPRAGYVSTWHDACVEVQDLALAYDAVFEGLARDPDLLRFLAAKAAQHKLTHPKSSFAELRRNIEERIFRDTLEHRPKIESNYPSTDATLTTLQTVLGWPGNRAKVEAMLDAMITKATAVDGVTGEKGIAGYTVIAPHALAELLGRYARADPLFMRQTLRRHPRLQAMYRFHLETWCLGQYYPRTGDTGSFAERTPSYAGLAFSRNPGISPSSFAFLWELHEATGDKDFVRLLYGANGSSTNGLPYDLFAADPAAFQANVARVLAQSGAEIKLASVNKTEWGLAILRSGEGAQARAAWLDYDSGERHGHADGMTIGLFAKGLDLLPDFGYPPVQYGGWSSPRAVWYTHTAAHNTVAVDGQNTKPGTGKTTLWFDGARVRAVRASGPKLTGAQQYERTLALVDISETDSYLVDVFRVAGGAEHTRFLHGHFGQLTAPGLSLAPVEETRFGSVMRGFHLDPNPAEGWSVDWAVEDHLKYLPPSSDVHLRHTDLTRGAEVVLAEAWVAVGQYGGTAESWIPSVLVRRRAGEPPLASTFVGVLEPYAGKSNIAGVRRLELLDAEGKPCPDGSVGVEVRLADGRTDTLFSANVEASSASGSSPSSAPFLAAQESGARFEGDLCLVRFNAANRPERVLFCRGKSLQVGTVVVRAKSDEASFEIDVGRKDAPVVAGPAEAVELIEVGGVKIWPK